MSRRKQDEIDDREIDAALAHEDLEASRIMNDAILSQPENDERFWMWDEAES